MLQGGCIYHHLPFLQRLLLPQSTPCSAQQAAACMLHTPARSLDSLHDVSWAVGHQETWCDSFTSILGMFPLQAVQQHTLCAGLRAECHPTMAAGETSRVCSYVAAGPLGSHHSSTHLSVQQIADASSWRSSPAGCCEMAKATAWALFGPGISALQAYRSEVFPGPTTHSLMALAYMNC